MNGVEIDELDIADPSIMFSPLKTMNFVFSQHICPLFMKHVVSHISAKLS